MLLFYLVFVVVEGSVDGIPSNFFPVFSLVLFFCEHECQR
jgi:hypothetical protein